MHCLEGDSQNGLLDAGYVGSEAAHIRVVTEFKRTVALN